MSEFGKNVSHFAHDIHAFLATSAAKFQKSLTSVYETSYKNEAALAYSVNHLLNLAYLQHALSSLEHTASDCRRNLIPRNVISDQGMQSRLRVLQEDIDKDGWEVAGKYISMLNLPIATCTFTEGYLFVTIQVPIERKASNLEVFELIPVPFQFGKTQCILHEVPNLLGVDGDRFIPITPHLSKTCSLLEHNYCLIPMYTKDPTGFTSCARALLQNSTPDDLSTVNKSI